MKVLSERIEDIITLIAEVANGNFDYKIDISETGDELDAVISGVSMLGQELKNSTVSRDFMKSVYQGVVDTLIILDMNFNIRIVNEATEELTGYGESELRGKHISFLFDAKENKHLQECIEQFRTGGKFLNAELTIASKSGRKIPSSSSFSYLKNNQKKNDGILIIAKDISRLKETERELQAAKNKAEAANEAKSNFLSNMSHEIRTPLNGIMGFTDLLMDSPLNESQRKYLKLIKTSGDTLTRLLNDILDLHRIEQDKISLESIPFNFRQTISSNLEPYRHLAEDKGVTFQNIFDEAIPEYVTGDPGRINQVLINLVSNAIKFTQEGSITIHHKAEPIDEDNSVILISTVTDTGSGIPKEKQRMIFDPFTQSDESITRKHGGWGLGLTISKKLISLMGGELGVISPALNQKNGTSFWFILKLKPSKADTSDEKSTSYSHFRLPKNAKILVVDDNEMNMMLMKDNLENLGGNVYTARDGREGVEMALSGNYSLVFMDMQMPVMSGPEAAKKLRQADFKPPIIAFSAAAYREDIKKSLEAGMNDYLCKPFTRNELISLLDKWI